MLSKLRLPSPALVVASIALFVALGGTAVAAGVVPLAKRALQADNAKKLGGRTPAQIVSRAAAQPGPASSAAALVATRTAAFTLNPQEQKMIAAPCAAGEKAVGGGFTYEGNALVLALDSIPTGDGAGWQVFLLNASEQNGASGSVQAVCIR